MAKLYTLEVRMTDQKSPRADSPHRRRVLEGACNLVRWVKYKGYAYTSIRDHGSLREAAALLKSRGILEAGKREPYTQYTTYRKGPNWDVGHKEFLRRGKGNELR